MGRKKKVTNLPTEKEIITPVSNSRIEYNGKIKVLVKKKNKTIISKSFKNSGRYPLFSFIAQCLVGNYKDAEINRPYSIVLFSIQKGTSITGILNTIADDGNLNFYAKNDNKLTYGEFPIRTLPNITVNRGGIGDAKVTYSFIIPFIHI